MPINIGRHEEALEQLTKKLSDEEFTKHCEITSLAFDSCDGIPKQILDQMDSPGKELVRCLIHLLLESCKMKLNEDSFLEEFQSLGFNDGQSEELLDLYTNFKNKIAPYVSDADIQFLEYHDMNWRFEVQVASRAAFDQMVPLVTMDLVLKGTDRNNLTHIPLQTDPANLIHMAQELEMALQEGRNHHTRKVAKMLK